MMTSRRRQNGVGLCTVVVDVKSRMAAVESGAFFQNQTETSQALELRILTISKVKTKRGEQEKVYFIGVRYG